MQTSWFPLSRVVIYGKTHSFDVSLSGSKLSFEFLWFESPLLEKKGVVPCKFSCSRFPGSDLYDIDGKKSHSTFPVVVSNEVSTFGGFNHNFLRKKKGVTYTNFVVPDFRGVIYVILMQKQSHTPINGPTP